MRPGNLMKLQVINCLACYDSGEVCECNKTSDQPAGGAEYILLSGTGGGLTSEEIEKIKQWASPNGTMRSGAP